MTRRGVGRVDQVLYTLAVLTWLGVGGRLVWLWLAR